MIEDPEDRIRRGQIAADQLNDSLMQELLPAYRAKVLEDLAKADPADMKEIIQLQSKIAVIDGLRDELEAFVTDAKDLTSEKRSYA